MSFISTATTRDELAEREAAEFDLDLAYVFGSQARYKADNCNGHYGTVIASYNIEHGGEVANVVYVSVEKPLYVIPASFFRPSKEILRLFNSNSQRRKRQENFALEDCVQLGYDEQNGVSWVTKASRHYNRLELFGDGFTGVDTIGVIRPAFEENGAIQERRLWTEKLGWFQDIPMWVKNDYLPDVAYRVRFHLITLPNLLDEEDLQPERLRMASFAPTFQFQLHEIMAVDDVHQEIVESMEWNTPTVVSTPNDSDSDEQLAFGLEKDKPKPERSQAIKNVPCLTTTATELYTTRCDRDPKAMVRAPWRHYWNLAPGTFVNVTLVYNKWNAWYIVADYSFPTDSEGSRYKSIPYEIDATSEYIDEHKVKLLIEIEVIELDQFYLHPFCGLVFDRERLLGRASLRSGDKRIVWAVHEQGVGTEEHPSNFVIHSISTREEMSKREAV